MNSLLVNVCLIVIQMNYIGCRLEVDKSGLYEFQFDHKMCGLTAKADIEYTIDHPNRGAHHSALNHKGWPLKDLWAKPKTERMGVLQREAPWVGLISMIDRNTGRQSTCNGVLLTPEWAFTSGECAYYVKYSGLPNQQLLFRSGPNMEDWEGFDVIGIPSLDNLQRLTDPYEKFYNYGLLHLANRSALSVTNEIHYTRNSICWPDINSPFDTKKGERAIYYAFDTNYQLTKTDLLIWECPEGVRGFARAIWCYTPSNLAVEDRSTSLCHIPFGGALVQYTKTHPYQAVLLGVGISHDFIMHINGTELCSFALRNSYFFSTLGTGFVLSMQNHIDRYRGTTSTPTTTRP